MLNAETRIVVLKLSSLSRSKDARNPTGFVSARSQLLMSCFTHSQKLLTSCVLKSTILNLLLLIGPWWRGAAVQYPDLLLALPKPAAFKESSTRVATFFS
jgi:hypothetical protein